MIKNKFFIFFLILTGFQITWVACVIGEIYDQYLYGIISALIYLAIYFSFIEKRANLLYIFIIFSIPGYLFDSYMAYTKYYYINSDLIFGYLPVWLIFLWLAFGTLLHSVFTFLKNKVLLSCILGILVGPLTYYSGIILNIAYTKNLNLYLLFIGSFWGILMIFYSLIIGKLNK